MTFDQPVAGPLALGASQPLRTGRSVPSHDLIRSDLVPTPMLNDLTHSPTPFIVEQAKARARPPTSLAAHLASREHSSTARSRSSARTQVEVAT